MTKNELREFLSLMDVHKGKKHNKTSLQKLLKENLEYNTLSLQDLVVDHQGGDSDDFPVYDNTSDHPHDDDLDSLGGSEEEPVGNNNNNNTIDNDDKNDHHDDLSLLFEGHTVPMLKDELRQRGLMVGGNKPELLERLRTHVQQQQQQQQNQGEEESKEVEEEEAEVEYDIAELELLLKQKYGIHDLTNVNLRLELSQRGIRPISGNKQQLLVRLFQHLQELERNEVEDVNNIDLNTIETPTMCVFDTTQNYQLTPLRKMELENRLSQDALLSPELHIPDETQSLIDLLPRHLRDHSPILSSNANANVVSNDLIEIVLDLGRRPTCWMAGGDGNNRHFLLSSSSSNHNHNNQNQTDGTTTNEEKKSVITTTANINPDDTTDNNDDNDTSTIEHTTASDTNSSPEVECINDDSNMLCTESTEDNVETGNTTIIATTIDSSSAGSSTSSNDDDNNNAEDDYLVTREDLQHVLGGLRFGQDNRAGIERCLHRISGVRNRDGDLVGATLRVGRYVPGNAILIADLLYNSNASILFVGPPGSAKTSILRDAARILSEKHSVVIVDTSNEIAGAGDIPHPCIGLSRRMQVQNIESQARVMIECVQNHTPSVIVIDEIGRNAEVQAALTCKERGVRIMASAHGSLPGLVRNAELCELVGGVDVVTIGDKSAQRQAASGGSASKLKAERKGPPVFDVVVELKRGQLHEWGVVLQTKTAVDNILGFGRYQSQIRRRHPEGKEAGIEIQNIVLEVNRDEIVDEQLEGSSGLKKLKPPSIMTKTHQEVFDSSKVDWDMYMAGTKKSRKHLVFCPVCNKMLKSNAGMMNHASNTNCRHQLPDHVLRYFLANR